MKPLIARKHLIIPILLISVLCLNGCALFYPKQIGENAASTTLDKLLAEVDTFIVETDSLKLVSGKLTQGALDSLLTPKTKAKLDSMLKALGVTADSTLDSIAAGFIAEILNDTAKKDVSEYVDELVDLSQEFV